MYSGRGTGESWSRVERGNSRTNRTPRTVLVLTFNPFHSLGTRIDDVNIHEWSDFRMNHARVALCKVARTTVFVASDESREDGLKVKHRSRKEFRHPTCIGDCHCNKIAAVFFLFTSRLHYIKYRCWPLNTNNK